MNEAPEAVFVVGRLTWWAAHTPDAAAMTYPRPNLELGAVE